MTNTNTEKIKNESVLKEALLEYEEVLKAAKNKLVENNSKELDSLIEKFLKESNEPKVAVNKEPKEGKIQESISIQKPIGEMKEEVAVVAPNTINMKEASLSEVEAAFDNASPNDDFQVVRNDGGQQNQALAGASNDQQQLPLGGNEDNFDLTSIEGEIDEMMKEINQAEQMQAQQAQQQQLAQQESPVDRFKKIHEEMGKYLKEIDEMNANKNLMEEFHSKMSEMYGETYKAQMEESKVNELFDMYKKVKGGNADKPVNQVQEEVAPSVAEKPVEESHGVSLSHNKHAGEEVQPRIENGKEYAAHRIRVALQNEATTKKISALIKENIALTTQLNKTKGNLSETTVKTKSMSSLNESYKVAIEKYRNQLKEMAVLNTNISYVNNLLVNENFALSIEDKKNIIEKFKPVASINESEKIYKEVLKEYSESKKSSIVESLENKIASTIVESSSANIIEESIGSDEHINKMLKNAGITPKKTIM